MDRKQGQLADGRCGAGKRVGGGDRVCNREVEHPPPHRDGSGAEWTDESTSGGQQNPDLLTPERP